MTLPVAPRKGTYRRVEAVREQDENASLVGGSAVIG